jgi:2-hydroxychromene-2-carboxylate isomerase
MRRAANRCEQQQSRAAVHPTFVIDGELWFGKDRLNDVEQAIVTRLGAAPSIREPERWQR